MPNTCKSSGNMGFTVYLRQFHIRLISHFLALALLVIALRAEKMRTKLESEIGTIRIESEA